MKSLAVLSISTLFLSLSAFANSDAYDQGTTQQGPGFESSSARPSGQIPKQENVHSQLDAAKQNLEMNEDNIQRAEARLKDDEAQVDVDKASVKKFKAQRAEDKAQLDKLENKIDEMEKN